MSSLQIIEPDPSRADWLPYAPAVGILHGATFVYLPGAVQTDDPESAADIVEQTRAVMRRHTDALRRTRPGLDRRRARVRVPHRHARDRSGAHHHGRVPAGVVAGKHAGGVNALARSGARFELDVIAVRPPQDEDGEDPALWMSGATAIPLYHRHPHVEEQCVLPDDIREQTRRAQHVRRAARVRRSYVGRCREVLSVPHRPARSPRVP